MLSCDNSVYIPFFVVVFFVFFKTGIVCFDCQAIHSAIRLSDLCKLSCVHHNKVTVQTILMKLYEDVYEVKTACHVHK